MRYSSNTKKFPNALRKFLPAVLIAGAPCIAQFSARDRDRDRPNQIPVVAPAGAVLRVRLNQALDTERSRPGDRFTGLLETTLFAEKNEFAPGAVVEGHAVDVEKAGKWKGSSLLSVTLDTIKSGGVSWTLRTNVVSWKQNRHGALTLIGGGSGAGALVGGLIAGPVGAFAGAGAGAAVGTAGVVKGNKRVYVPAETIIAFTIAATIPSGEQARSTAEREN